MVKNNKIRGPKYVLDFQKETPYTNAYWYIFGKLRVTLLEGGPS